MMLVMSEGVAPVISSIKSNNIDDDEFDEEHYLIVEEIVLCGKSMGVVVLFWCCDHFYFGR